MSWEEQGALIARSVGVKERCSDEGMTNSEKVSATASRHLLQSCAPSPGEDRHHAPTSPIPRSLAAATPLRDTHIRTFTVTNSTRPPRIANNTPHLHHCRGLAGGTCRTSVIYWSTTCSKDHCRLNFGTRKVSPSICSSTTAAGTASIAVRPIPDLVRQWDVLSVLGVELLPGACRCRCSEPGTSTRERCPIQVCHGERLTVTWHVPATIIQWEPSCLRHQCAVLRYSFVTSPVLSSPQAVDVGTLSTPHTDEAARTAGTGGSKGGSCSTSCLPLPSTQGCSCP